MPTGRSFASRCPARAALAGNPSDGYGGAVVALPIDDLAAMASTSEAASFSIASTDPDLARLLTATAREFEARVTTLPPATLSASTTIPRSVGLAGSSALVIATLRALSAWVEHRWQPIELAEAALAVERDRLGITAGLQDRLVQSVGRLVAMTFRPVTYEPIAGEFESTIHDHLFIAWSTSAPTTSDVVHRSIRRRYDGGDPDIHLSMRQLAEQAAFARRGIETGNFELVGAAMNRTFDVRAEMFDVGDHQRALVETGRTNGAAINSAGSGGSVVGLVRDPGEIDMLRQAYEQTSAEFLALR